MTKLIKKRTFVERKTTHIFLLQINPNATLILSISIVAMVDTHDDICIYTKKNVAK
jgi:hypothetical protein